MFRWTWEYAEHLIDNRPDAVRAIMDSINVQISVDKATSQQHEWFS